MVFESINDMCVTRINLFPKIRIFSPKPPHGWVKQTRDVSRNIFPINYLNNNYSDNNNPHDKVHTCRCKIHPPLLLSFIIFSSQAYPIRWWFSCSKEVVLRGIEYNYCAQGNVRVFSALHGLLGGRIINSSWIIAS